MFGPRINEAGGKGKGKAKGSGAGPARPLCHDPSEHWEALGSYLFPHVWRCLGLVCASYPCVESYGPGVSLKRGGKFDQLHMGARNSQRC